MKDAAETAFGPVSRSLEGYCPWMYLDEKGLVTTAIGDLIDPKTVALSLPWQWLMPDGSLGAFVNEADIATQWERVKLATTLERDGGGAFKSLTQIRLSDANIDKLVTRVANSFEATLAKRFDNWNELCADAQFGTMLMAWAMGPDFHYPRFQGLLSEEKFALYTLSEDGQTNELTGGCAVECYMPDQDNPGLVPRNAIVKKCFIAAQNVNDQGLDPNVLQYTSTEAAVLPF